MQAAEDKSVLGDFANAKFRYAGVTSTYFKRGGRFFVNNDGPDGRPTDFEIKYTFGVAPLQQYLIEFPGGRLQVFSIAWDARPKGEGGGAGSISTRARRSTTRIRSTGPGCIRAGTSSALRATRRI